jgi:hypothetical protein
MWVIIAFSIVLIGSSVEDSIVDEILKHELEKHDAIMNIQRIPIECMSDEEDFE